MTIYEVKGRVYTHYGVASMFARRIGANVNIRKTYNPFKYAYAAMN